MVVCGDDDIVTELALAHPPVFVQVGKWWANNHANALGHWDYLTYSPLRVLVRSKQSTWHDECSRIIVWVLPNKKHVRSPGSQATMPSKQPPTPA